MYLSGMGDCASTWDGFGLPPIMDTAPAGGRIDGNSVFNSCGALVGRTSGALPTPGTTTYVNPVGWGLPAGFVPVTSNTPTPTPTPAPSPAPSAHPATHGWAGFGLPPLMTDPPAGGWIDGLTVYDAGGYVIGRVGTAPVPITTAVMPVDPVQHGGSNGPGNMLPLPWPPDDPVMTTMPVPKEPNINQNPDSWIGSGLHPSWKLWALVGAAAYMVLKK